MTAVNGVVVGEVEYDTSIVWNLIKFEEVFTKDSVDYFCVFRVHDIKRLEFRHFPHGGFQCFVIEVSVDCVNIFGFMS